MTRTCLTCTVLAIATSAIAADLPDVALSDFEVAAALSLLAATTGEGPANHTKSPVTIIKAERPLALTIIWQSPHLPAPIAK